MRELKVTAAVIIKEGKILIARRGPGQAMAGMWEFPGGKIDPGETAEQCVTREVMEELNIEIGELEFYMESEHRFDDTRLLMYTYRASLQKGHPVTSVHTGLRWVETSELPNFEFAPADRPVVEQLLADR